MPAAAPAAPAGNPYADAARRELERRQQQQP